MNCDEPKQQAVETTGDHYPCTFSKSIQKNRVTAYTGAPSLSGYQADTGQ